MKKFLIILITILLSAPLSSLLSYLTLNLMMDDDSNFWLSVIIVVIYEVPIYFVVGLPVTLLIDFVLKLTGASKTKNVYLFQLLLYSLVAAFFGLYLYFTGNENWNNVAMAILALIAVYTYSHILFFLRKRFN